MSIEKHPTKEGWYYVKHYPGGRNKPPERIPIEGFGPAQALDITLKQAKGHSSSKITHPRLEEVVEDYLTWARKIKKLSPVTMKNKTRRLYNYILPYFGKYRVRDIDQTLLDKYAADMPTWMYATDLAHLMALIRWMIKRKHADRLSWEPERVNGNHAVKAVPHPGDLITAIESMKKEQHRVLFKFMLYTGLRWNEARNIQWQDIDLRSGSIRIKEIIDGPQDIIYIPEPLQTWFETNSKEKGFVFESAKMKGQPVKNLWKVLEDAGKKTGIHLSPHVFRHASGTYLYEHSNDIYKVQAHLRHKKISSTQIYTRMSVKRRQTAVNTVIDYVVNHLDL